MTIGLHGRLPCERLRSSPLSLHEPGNLWLPPSRISSFPNALRRWFVLRYICMDMVVTGTVRSAGAVPFNSQAANLPSTVSESKQTENDTAWQLDKSRCAILKVRNALDCFLCNGECVVNHEDVGVGGKIPRS